jgi:hypothetical protein
MPCSFSKISLFAQSLMKAIPTISSAACMSFVYPLAKKQTGLYKEVEEISKAFFPTFFESYDEFDIYQMGISKDR